MELTSAIPLKLEQAWDADTWFQHLKSQQHEAQQVLLDKAWQRVRDNAAQASNPELYLRRRCAAVEVLHDTLGMDSDTLVATLLDKQQSEQALAHVRIEFGAAVGRLVDGMGRIDFIHSLHTLKDKSAKTKDPNQTEHVRKMFFAMAEDARVVLIKLAERLYDMRMLRFADTERQRRLAAETLEIFAPLANRLGIWTLKWELEDLAFRFQSPEVYLKLAKSLEAKRTEREQYITEVVALLKEKLSAAGIDADIKGRPKHIYSMWKKMQRKNIELKQLFDVFAVRALVDSDAHCYSALGIVHGAWQPVQGEFDDYIAAPKKNGYRSLHTAVYGPGDKPFEIQIRTRNMHNFAELGVASHWRYKEGVSHDSGFEQKLAWLRQVLQDGAEGEDMMGEFNAEIGEDRVYVLTPEHKIIDLPLGSTPVDFAYAIHTSLGHRCRGAKVNNHMVSLTYNLKSGDRVEIIPVNDEQPSRDWRAPGQKYLKSQRAISAVKAWFKRQDSQQHAVHGRESLERELKRLSLKSVNYQELAQHFNFKNTEDLFAAVGRTEIGIVQIVNTLREKILPPPKQNTLALHKPSAGTHDAVQVQGVDGLLTHMASCCKPVPPDPLIGYITRTQGISVHRADCPQVIHLRETEKDRLIEVDWYHADNTVYAVDIEVEAYDRTGLLRDVSTVLSNEKVNITAVYTGNAKHQDEAWVLAKMTITIEVHNTEQLSSVLAKIEQLQNVVKVSRKG